MKVLVTGGAGFIGANLVYYLREYRPSWEVVVLDALTYSGNRENLAPLLAKNEVRFVQGDIRDRSVVDALFSGERFDLVFHLAAESHVDRSLHDPLAFVTTNVVGTQVLLQAARATGVGRFVHVSTDEVYGSLGPTGFFTEHSPIRPSSAYSASKASSDLLALAEFHTHHLPVVVTRCTNNYGPYQFPEKLIPLFVTNALTDQPLPLYGDGRHVRSWLHVRDHCKGLLMVAEKGRLGEVYNIGSGSEGERENREVTAEILKLLAKPATLIRPVADRPGHDRRYAIDPVKLREEFGWVPEISFAEGLRETVKWYIDHRDWWERVKSGAYRTEVVSGRTQMENAR